MKDFGIKMDGEIKGENERSSTLPKTLSHSIEEILRKPCRLADPEVLTVTDSETPDVRKKLTEKSLKAQEPTGILDYSRMLSCIYTLDLLT